MAQIKPMRGVHAKDLNDLKYPLAASPKLDGIRALVRDGVVLSKTLKPIPNKLVQLYYGIPELNGLDGELILGDSTDSPYKRTHSCAMSKDSPYCPTFHVFDYFSMPDAPFITRHTKVIETAKMFCPAKGVGLSVVPHNRIDSVSVLELYENAVLGMGYEGVMLRDINGPYKYGQATLKQGWLLKLKRFTDGEAEIIGLKEQMHNNNVAFTDELGQTKRSTHAENMIPTGVLGTFVVRDLETGVEFEIGTGFDAAERDQFWRMGDSLIGSFVKYKHFAYGQDKRPRHPVFLGFRDEMDISK